MCGRGDETGTAVGICSMGKWVGVGSGERGDDMGRGNVGVVGKEGEMWGERDRGEKEGKGLRKEV